MTCAELAELWDVWFVQLMKDVPSLEEWGKYLDSVFNTLQHRG